MQLHCLTLQPLPRLDTVACIKSCPHSLATQTQVEAELSAEEAEAAWSEYRNAEEIARQQRERERLAAIERQKLWQQQINSAVGGPSAMQRQASGPASTLQVQQLEVGVSALVCMVLVKCGAASSHHA